MQIRLNPVRIQHLLLVVLCFISCGAFAQPAINSFAPASGPVGATVTITGSNFSPTAAGNIVYFGAVKATVTAANTTSITVTVPAGATYQPITVTVNGLTGYSARPFNTTYADPADLTGNSFEGLPGVTTDLHPNGIAAADFDGDGLPDLATPNNYSTTGSPASVSILRNTSSGGAIQFAPKQDIPTGVLTYAIAAADLDGDGKPELISSSIVDKTISVFRNTSTNGSITFAAKIDYPVGTNPYSIAIADFDADGRPDVAVANFLSNSISVLRNTSTTSGSISLAPKTDIITGLAPHGVATGDLDGDGKPDMAVVNQLSNTMSVFRNTSNSGTISFAARADFPTAAAPYGVAIGDLDGDNKQDVAVANNENQLFSVFRNTGSTGAVSFAARADFAAAYGGYSIALGDVSGDGRPDVVVASTSPSIAQNTSTPGTISFATSIYPYYSLDVFVMAIVDLNADGRNDLTGAVLAGDRLTLLRNRNNEPAIGSFTPAQAGTGEEVTITGRNFTGATSVSFGGVPAASFTVVNGTTIKAIVGTGISGDVAVINQHGKGSRAGFTFTGPPVIQSFSPTIAEKGTTVTITGINFYGTTAVSFGNVPAQSFSVVSPTSINAVVGDGASGDVKVTNPWGTSNQAGFGILPSIYSFAPQTAAVGSTVTITGSNFTGVTSVHFGGVPAASFTIVSPTSIMAVVANGASGNISVANPHGTVTKAGFTFIDPPVITDFTPTAAGNGITVTITGNFFTNVSAVTFGGTPALDFTVVSVNTIKARVAAGPSGNVAVTTPGGTAVKSGFTFVETPKITSFTPTLTGAGGKVTITGTYLSNATSVTLGGTAAASFTVVSPTSIEAIVASGSNGIITVITPGGTAVSLNNFTFTTVPVINSFSPVAGGIGTTITIQGANFSPVVANNTVYIGRVKAQVSAATTNTITVVVPAGAVSGTISVTSNGLSCTTEQSFIITFPGAGPFTQASFAGRVDFATGLKPRNVAAGDIDGDGKPDLLVANEDAQTISVYRNTSSGGKLSFAPRIDYYAGAYPRSITLGDINGDGKLEIACLNFRGPDLIENSVSLFKNNSTPGSISLDTRIVLATAQGPFNMAIQDMNRDGTQDIIVANNVEGTFGIFQHNGNATDISFMERRDVYLPFDHPETHYIGQFTEFAIMDINSDNLPDVIAGNTGTDILILYNNGPALIHFIPKALNYHGFSESYSALLAADFNNDGKSDLVTTHRLVTNTATGFSMVDAIYFGKLNAAAGDFDGDGKIDYVKPDYSNNAVIINKNNSVSALSFAAGVSYGTGNGPMAVCVADFNLDGRPDIATANFTNNTASILLNRVGVAPGSAITSFTPANGPQGTVVTINGTGFTNVTAVNFGDQPAASFTVNSSTQITATVGAGSSGNVRVMASGSELALGWFSFVPPPPSITSFTPTTAVDWATVTITGTNFTDVTNVTFGDKPAYMFTVNSPTSITATIREGATGNVVVTTAGGSAAATGTFTYINPPDIYSFTPNRAASLDTITIQGKYLTGVTAVSFGDIPVASFMVTNDQEIKALVGAGANGRLKVSGPHGIDSMMYFTYLNNAAIRSFTPENAQPGTVVTITGYNLGNATAVSFGGVAAASFTIQDDNTIKATVGQGATGEVKVVTPNGTALKQGFTFVVVTAMGDPTTGTGEMNIYPNPAITDQVVVTHPSSVTKASIRVIDINGKIVQLLNCNRQATTTILPVNKLARGVYKIIWSNGKRELAQSLLVP